MAKKHFMIYYKKGTGTVIVTEPRPWSRENTNLFSEEYDFIVKFPTTNNIEKLLIKNYNFKKVINEKGIVLLQNLDINFDFIRI